MAKVEHPEQYGWWLNELDSLGISTLQKDGINNRRDASDLTDAVKQTLYLFRRPIESILIGKLSNLLNS
jgi:hypothetical protein